MPLSDILERYGEKLNAHSLFGDFFFLELLKSIVVSAHILIGDCEWLAANNLSHKSTCSKRLYRFKVFLDPQWGHLLQVSLEVKPRKNYLHCVFFGVSYDVHPCILSTV